MVAMATHPDPCAACSEAHCCSTTREKGETEAVSKKKKREDSESGWDHLLQPSLISPTRSIPTLWFMPNIISSLHVTRIRMSLLP